MKIFHWIFCVSAIAVLNFVDSENIEDKSLDYVSESIREDASIPLPLLVSKYGYPFEVHKVQTEDGYILTLYRIPHGRRCGPERRGKVPVLLQHGLFNSAFDYLILGPQKSLGYLLSDRCYDVWLGNNRGTHHSKLHVKLRATDPEFWKFTWHEMGKYDIPAMIDYILANTKQRSLHYVGHSQGTTQFFAFAALRPEYHSKIRSMHCLSPVVFMGNLSGPISRTLALFYKPLETLADMVGLYEFIPQYTFLNFLGREICRNDYPDLQSICSNVIFLFCGFDEPQLNRTILPVIIGHTPDGASSKQLVHYAQGIKSGAFRQFDFGWWENLKRYKSIVPPEYDLSKINIPMALYYGTNDWFSSVKDIEKLRKILPNVIEMYKVPYSKFNHVDFIYATDVYHLLYKRVLEVMDKY